jgi:hypothetical protein
MVDNNKKEWTILSLSGFLLVLIIDNEKSFFYHFGWVLFVSSFWILWWQHYNKSNKHILENIHLILMGIALFIATLGVFIQLLKVIF